MKYFRALGAILAYTVLIATVFMYAWGMWGVLHLQRPSNTARVLAQGTGTITVSTQITATAGALQCVFTNPNHPAIHTVCSISGVAQTPIDITPKVTTGSVTVDFHESADAITWMLSQPTAGTVAYQVTANGTVRSGNF